MVEDKYQDSLIYQVDGPTCKDDGWEARVVVKQQESETLHGKTRKEVQEQILRYLGQQALEIEKARVLLRRAFEAQSENS